MCIPALRDNNFEPKGVPLKEEPWVVDVLRGNHGCQWLEVFYQRGVVVKSCRTNLFVVFYCILLPTFKALNGI